MSRTDCMFCCICVCVSMESEAEFGFVWKWRKYLLLLTTLVVSATYVAGLNPPGGLYIEDFDGHRVGDPVLSSTHHGRYAVFFYCNAAAFLSSLVVVMILLDQRIAGSRVGFAVLRSVMLVDLLALMGAFAAGSFRHMITSIYVLVAFVALLAYVAIHLRLMADGDGGAEASSDGSSAELDLKGRSKLPLLLASFATPLTYAAGMVPPGGAWLDDISIMGQSAGDPVLRVTHQRRYRAFSYCNATCFVSSLAIITLLVSKRKLSGRIARSSALQVCVLVDLLGLMGAYAAGSCRAVRLDVYSLCLAGAVLLYIGIFCMETPKKWLTQACCLLLQESGNLEEHDDAPDTLIRDPENIVVKQQVKGSWSLLLLLGTLTAAVTYQAGLNPPGGFWREGSNHGLMPGSPGLLDIQPHRYNAFFYSNTTAFVASLAMIVIVQSKQRLISGSVVRRRLLQVAIILSQFGLMGAYASGSSRDISTTIYVSALAAANAVAFMTLDMLGSRKLMPWVEGMIYNILHKLRLLDHHDDGQSKGEEEEEDSVNQLEKKRKSLLQLAILAAAVTYQTGLTSTGGFWELDLVSNSSSRHITDTILLGHDRSRYLVFFYCNAAEFMVSVTVILHLVNRRLHSQSSIRSNVLQACVMVGFLGLRTAYALGSSRKVSTSIYVIGLVVAVVTYLALQILPPLLARCVGGKPAVPPWLPSWLRRLFEPLPLRPNHQKRKINSSESGRQQHIQEHANKYTKRKYLLLLGVLTTNMTYQAGLTPPGSTWTEYGDGNRPGDPIMASTNAVRYQAFYYCNTTSFLASVILIVLLLQRTVSPRGTPLRAMQAAMALDLAGLLGAYAVGTYWTWNQALAYVTVLLTALVIYAMLLVLPWRGNTVDPAAASSHQPAGNAIQV
uniref:Uncharacterized protein n=1 Tax=Avena sativa TaxID=4498 RepID=A0ACD5TAS0_AVESA